MGEFGRFWRLGLLYRICLRSFPLERRSKTGEVRRTMWAAVPKAISRNTPGVDTAALYSAAQLRSMDMTAMIEEILAE